MFSNFVSKSPEPTANFPRFLVSHPSILRSGCSQRQPIMGWIYFESCLLPEKSNSAQRGYINLTTLAAVDGPPFSRQGPQQRGSPGPNATPIHCKTRKGVLPVMARSRTSMFHCRGDAGICLVVVSL